MTLRNTIPALVLILGMLNCVHFSTANECEYLQKSFSNVTKGFFGCALSNAEPVHYCRRCGSEANGFANVIIKYNELVSKDECRSKYFDQDRINIIEMVYSNAKSLWDAGSCSNCYDWVDGNFYQNESQIATKFFDALDTYGDCYKANKKNETICSNCADNYNIVNDIYKTIKKDTDDKFCFDIKDAMNKTRLDWSHNLKCCKDRKTSLTTFIVTSAIISVLIPFVFYTSFMFFGWRRDQVQEPLIDSDMQPSEAVTSRSTVEVGGPCVAAITNVIDVE